jgi:hypothetical protein
VGAACGGAAGGLIDWVVVGAAGALGVVVAGGAVGVVVDETVVEEELAADVLWRWSRWTDRWVRRTARRAPDRRPVRREPELAVAGSTRGAAALAWPGNARAAALARNTVKATMAVAIPRLSQRRRRSEASRRFAPR